MSIYSVMPQEGAKLDVSGAWVFEVQTDLGSGAPTFTFKQDGEKLSGTYKGTFGEAPLTGTLKGKDITFTFSANAQGVDVTFNYIGTVAENEMKGTLDANAAGQSFAGTWKGKRQAK